MTSIEKFIERCRNELNLNLPTDIEVRRTYAGYWQRGAGAWSWFFYCRSNSGWSMYGSSYPVTDLLKAKELEVDISYRSCYIEIIPKH